MVPTDAGSRGRDAQRAVALMLDYAFGRGVGRYLPSDGVTVTRSRRSGRIRLIHHGSDLFATVKPSGSVALSIDGARLLSNSPVFRNNYVRVTDDAAGFVRGGKSVFCKFVTSAGTNVFPNSEVIVVNGGGSVLGVGTSVVGGSHMLQFKSGIAVKVRAGVKRHEDGQ